MREIRSQIIKIKKILQRKTVLTHETPIFIRDILAYQIVHEGATNPVGEFEPHEIFRDKKIKEQAAKIETDIQLVSRIVSYIGELANIAANIHLKNNFDNPQYYEMPKEWRDIKVDTAEKKSIKKSESILKLNRLNHVTRLSLHEFALYPHKARGPLSIECFQILIEKTSILAAQYPQNLHFALGTIPVKVKMKTSSDKIINVLQNIAIYVECGTHPKIHTFTKVIPSDSDIRYTGVDHIRAIESFAYQLFLNEYKRCINSLRETPDELKLDDIRKLQYSIKNLFVKSTEGYTDLLEKLAEIEKNTEKKAYCIKETGRQLARMDFKELAMKMAKFDKSLNLLLHKMIFPPIALSDSKETGLNIHYGGNFICKTEGGHSFRVVGEICVDHHYGIGKQRVKQDLELKQHRAQSILPKYASHLVLSNTIEMEKDKLISASLTHADPCDFSVYGGDISKLEHYPVEFNMELKNPEFGSDTKLNIYKEYALSPHVEEIDADIATHNEFMITLEALRLYRNAHPDNIDILDRMIELHLLESLIKTFAVQLQDSYVDSFIPSALKDIRQSLQKHADIHSILYELKERLAAVSKTTLSALSKEQISQIQTKLDIILNLIELESNNSHVLRNQLSLPKATTLKPSLLKEIYTSLEAELGTVLLVYAAKFQDLTGMQKLIDENIDVNSTDSSGKNALYYAIEAGHTNIVKTLLEVHATLASIDKTITPLHLAAKNHRFNMIKIFLEKRCDINIRDLNDCTPLHYVPSMRMQKDSSELELLLIQALIENKANPTLMDNKGESILHKIARSDSSILLTYLLDIDKSLDINKPNSVGLTPAHIVAETGSVQTIKTLINNKADFTKLDNQAKTPIDYLITNNQWDGLVELLSLLPETFPIKIDHLVLSHSLIRRINAIHSQSEQIQFVKHFLNHKSALSKLLLSEGPDSFFIEKFLIPQALYKHNIGILKELISWGVDLKKYDNQGETRFHIAAQHSQVNTMQTLLSLNIDPNLPNKNGKTPLELAFMQGELNSIFYLLTSKNIIIPRDIINEPIAGQTLLDHALTSGRADVVKSLLSAKAHFDETDPEGNTPLHHAVYDGFIQAVDLLLTHKADPNVSNSAGIAPIHLIKLGSPQLEIELIKSLLEHKADLTLKDDYSNTFWHIIAVKGSCELWRELSQESKLFDINNYNRSQQTPMHIAIQYNNFSVLAEMVSMKADLSMLNKKGDSPIDMLIARNKWDKVIEMLLLTVYPYRLTIDKDKLLEETVKFVKSVKPEETLDVIARIKTEGNVLFAMLKPESSTLKLYDKKHPQILFETLSALEQEILEKKNKGMTY